MRTTKSLVLTAVWLAASGCMKTQSHQATQQPTATRAPSEATESAQAQPENEMAPPSATAPAPQATAAPQGPAAGGTGAEPGGAAAMRLSAHDLVGGALACAAAPTGGPPWSRGAGAGAGSTSPSGASGSGGATATGPMDMDQACASLAGIFGVPAQSLRVGDRAASGEIRNAIDKVGTTQNLSSSMREQLLSFFDKGMAAVRERSEAQGVVSRIAGTMGMGGGPRTNPSGSAPSGSTGPSGGGGPAGAMGRATGSAGGAVSSSDADALRAHDSLHDLVQFAHGSNAGALSSEAEGLAWLIAAERFMSTGQLPPKLKVLAAEPLFDTLLGVPTPAAAKGNPQAFPNRLWAQYLSAGSKAARESGAGSAAGVGGVPPTGGTTGGTAAGGRAGRGGGTETNDWRQIVSLLQQRIDSFAQQIPPSDLRQTMSVYAQELRSAAVGGGPAMPMHPGNMPHMPHSRPGTSAPSGQGQQPGGGMGAPSGGSPQPQPGGAGD